MAELSMIKLSGKLSKKSSKKILVYALLGVILLALLGAGIFSWKNRCTERLVLNTSVTVKDIGGRKLVGLNADTDSLNFGVLSPGISGKRSIVLARQNDAIDAISQVSLKGSMASWISIIPPPPISLAAGKGTEVTFELDVPGSAASGNYAGQVAFCIQEKK